MKIKDVIKSKIKVKIPKKNRREQSEPYFWVITDNNKLCCFCKHNRKQFHFKNELFKCSKCKRVLNYNKKYINEIYNAKSKEKK